MNKINDKITKLEQTIYIYVVNVASLLKTLKKAGVEDETTIKLANNASFIHFEFMQASKSNDKKDVIQNIILKIKEIQDILIKNYEEINSQIMHEKADLMIETNSLEQQLQEIMKNQ